MGGWWDGTRLGLDLGLLPRQLAQLAHAVLQRELREVAVEQELNVADDVWAIVDDDGGGVGRLRRVDCVVDQRAELVRHAVRRAELDE